MGQNEEDGSILILSIRGTSLDPPSSWGTSPQGSIDSQSRKTIVPQCSTSTVHSHYLKSPFFNTGYDSVCQHTIMSSPPSSSWPAQAHQQSHQLHHTLHPHLPPNGLNTASSNLPGATQSIRIPPGPGSNAVNFSFAPGTAAQHCGPAQSQGLGGMGGIGQGFRPPGQKLGPTFDHILSCLQGELQKFKETSAELQHLAGTLGNIHGTLSGSIPLNLPSFDRAQLPPIRPSQQEPPVASTSGPATSETSSSLAFSPMNSILNDMMCSLATHIDKVHTLEGIYKVHEAIKFEVSIPHEFVECSKALSSLSSHPELEWVDEEDEELAPVNTGMDKLMVCLTTLSNQLASVLEVSSNLQVQYLSLILNTLYWYLAHFVDT